MTSADLVDASRLAVQQRCTRGRQGSRSSPLEAVLPDFCMQQPGRRSRLLGRPGRVRLPQVPRHLRDQRREVRQAGGHADAGPEEQGQAPALGRLPQRRGTALFLGRQVRPAGALAHVLQEREVRPVQAHDRDVARAVLDGSFTMLQQQPGGRSPHLVESAAVGSKRWQSHQWALSPRPEPGDRVLHGQGQRLLQALLQPAEFTVAVLVPEQSAPTADVDVAERRPGR
jgi:hypothetical protein